jgi:hypothetical protein
MLLECRKWDSQGVLMKILVGDSSLGRMEGILINFRMVEIREIKIII